MRSRHVRRLVPLLVAAALLACGDDRSPRERTVVTLPAPDSFRVALATTKGTIVVAVQRSWAPRGADRLYELVQTGFLDGAGFFRVVPEFIAQFGLNDRKRRNEEWDARTIPDDPPREHNARGTVTFAHDGPNTRAHQIFINLGDNARLDRKGFVPVGRVVEGMNVVDAIYGGYEERPDQHLIRTLGNSYLRRMFPKLDYITTATIVGAPAAAPPTP